MKLSITKPKRLFTFGCSFTHYRWATWANILAYELDCEFYNFGKSGAGNNYIINQITQANNHYNFNKDDLVVICWTNISREDRYKENKGWITPGNIYSQNEYDANFVKNWANDMHFALMNFSLIDLASKYLQGTNYHFLSMCDITRQINQWEEGTASQKHEVARVAALYYDSLSQIAPSFYSSLWDNDMDNKWKKDWANVHKNYSDGHPTPLEHLRYLQSVFDYKFSKNTVTTIKKLQIDWVEYIRENYKNSKRHQGIYELPQSVQKILYNNFILLKGEPIPPEIWH